MEYLSDSDLVRKISNSLIGTADRKGNPPATEEMLIFYDVYCLDLEIGSGASFDQYFCWSSSEKVGRILEQLKKVGLHKIIALVRAAIEVAFPRGIPSDPNAYEECTFWTEEQEFELSRLYKSEPTIHEEIENKLAGYARRNGLLFLV